MITSPCIPSLNKPNPTHGYALRSVAGRRVYEHTLAWEEANGPVPEGKVLDHLCHDPKVCKGGPTCPHRACRNAEHLTAVTRAENVSRERSSRPALVEECLEGHAYTEANTYVDPLGRRHCRKCRPKHQRAHRRKHGVPERGSATECGHGHAYTPENTYVRPDTGQRQCRECRRQRKAEFDARSREGQAWDAAADEPGPCACPDESHAVKS